MGKWISNFNTASEFNAFQETSGYSEPHVTLIKDGSGVNFIPPETRVVAKYNVTSTSNPTNIGFNQYISGFSAIEIDGVAQPSVVSAYTFSTTGEHTVKYALTNPTSIGMGAFYECTGLTSIDMPDGVTSIGSYAFYNCRGLTSINIPSGVTSIDDGAFRVCRGLTSIDIPSGVTSIGSYAFYDCFGLTSITIRATTPPTLSNVNAFDKTNNCPIYVPNSSYVAATNWSSLGNRLRPIQ